MLAERFSELLAQIITPAFKERLNRIVEWALLGFGDLLGHQHRKAGVLIV